MLTSSETTVIALVLFGALILASGCFVRARQADFFLSGRRAGTATVASSLLATCLGASATLGVVARAYRLGWSAFWWLGAGAAGLIVLGLFWAKPMRRKPATRTLPQWAGEIYGLPARILAAVLIVVMWTAVIAAQWVAAGTLLGTLLPVPVELGITVAAALVVLYTAWGGQASVLRTDVLQIAMILGAILLLLAFAGRLEGMAQSPAGATAGESAGLTAIGFVSLLVVVGGMYVVGPDLCSRVLVARSDATARRGALWAGAILLPCSVAIVFLGILLRQKGVELGHPREALPWLIVHSGILPQAVGSLVAVGMLAALMSSADTCLLTAASVLELDLLGRTHTKATQQRAGRAFVAGVGLASTAVAILRPAIIANLLLAYAFYAGGLLVPLLLLKWPAFAGRIPRPWIWAAMLCGGLVPSALLLSGRATSTAIAGTAGAVAALGIVAAGRLCSGRLSWMPSQNEVPENG